MVPGVKLNQQVMSAEDWGLSKINFLALYLFKMTCAAAIDRQSEAVSLFAAGWRGYFCLFCFDIPQTSALSPIF
jgi:hypothetical protein